MWQIYLVGIILRKLKEQERLKTEWEHSTIKIFRKAEKERENQRTGMERMMKTLGIDIGTTSVSLSVLDGESGEQIKAVTVGNDSFIETAEPWAH